MSCSTHANNKTKNILVLGDGFTQGLDNITLYAEKMYSSNFTGTSAKFCLTLHNNGDDSYLFVNGKEIIKFKGKTSEILPYSLYLASISKYFTAEYIIKTGLAAYIYDLSL